MRGRERKGGKEREGGSGREREKREREGRREEGRVGERENTSMYHAVAACTIDHVHAWRFTHNIIIAIHGVICVQQLPSKLEF